MFLWLLFLLTNQILVKQRTLYQIFSMRIFDFCYWKIHTRRVKSNSRKLIPNLDHKCIRPSLFSDNSAPKTPPTIMQHKKQDILSTKFTTAVFVTKNITMNEKTFISQKTMGNDE